MMGTADLVWSIKAFLEIAVPLSATRMQSESCIRTHLPRVGYKGLGLWLRV